jgi:hypothetical protein
METSDEFMDRLRDVVQFLQANGFSKAADSVIETWESIETKPSLDTVDEQQQTSLHSAPGAFGEDLDFADLDGRQEEYRSRSAEPVLVSRYVGHRHLARAGATCMFCRGAVLTKPLALLCSRGASEEADEGREEQRQSPWLPEDAAGLTKRLSGECDGTVCPLWVAGACLASQM